MTTASALEVAGLLERYPLKVSIPSSQLAKGSMQVTRHTEYVIAIDDCGRAYPPRLRRFKNFKWLHDQLRRLQLSCALPELPPAKVWGRFDTEFVEVRRSRLEEYLKALLLLPPVIQDNTIWSFLDTDKETHPVPRFLCRPPDLAQTLDRLRQLKLCVQGDEIFRLCNGAVTSDLTNFVRSEGGEALPLSQPRLQEDIRLRLQIRGMLCSVVRLLLKHDRAELARQLLGEAGLFGALLALLCRTTADAAALRATAAGPAALPAAAATECRELLEKVGVAAQDCLQSMIERSRGAALLHFCQQDGGLSGLRRLIDTESLHIVAARLLWHGLQHSGVVVALAGPAAGGLQLLEQLMGSPDLKARLLASLSLGCMAAHKDALEAPVKQKCFEGIAAAHLPAALDAEESAAMNRAVEAEAANGAFGAPSPFVELPEDVPAAVQHAATVGAAMASSSSAGDARRRPKAQSFPVPPSEAGAQLQTMGTSSSQTAPGSRAQASSARKPRTCSEDATRVKPLRKSDLVEVLNSLCVPDGLARLQALLCGGAFTPLALLVAAVLDHFTRQVEDRDRLDMVLALAPALRRFLGDASAAEPEEETAHCLDEGGIHELRVRTARVLVRIAPVGRVGKEPAGVEVTNSALRVLELLTMHSEATQVQAAERLSHTKEHGNELEQLVQSSGLAAEPCLARAQLDDFAARVVELGARREALGQEVRASQTSSEAILVQLDQFGVNHGVFKTDVIALHSEVQAHMQEEESAYQAAAVVRECEARHSDATERSRAAGEEHEECKLAHGRASRYSHEMECRALALAQRENELAETCHKAPAVARQLEDRHQDLRGRRGTLQEELQQVLSVMEQVKRREKDLLKYQREAQDALKNLDLVRGELGSLREHLKNELVHTPDEIDQLKALELKLQPARPSRLRRGGDETPEDTASSPPGGDIDAPAWHDLKVEQAFHANPNFRSLQDLCEQRSSLWSAEQRWAAEGLTAVRSELVSQQNSHQELRKTDEKTQWEEEQVRRQITEVNDHEGHAKRHQDAQQDALEAQTQAQEASRELASATGRLKAAEVCLEQVLKEASAAGEELRKAQEAANAASERCSRSRAALEKRCGELQEKARAQLKAWQALRVQECWLELSQRRVAGSIQTEAARRAHLRAEAQRLIQELHRLDEQLAVEPLVEG